MDIIPPFQYYCDRMCTVAFYGSEGPYLFDGHLVMKSYFQDEDRNIDSLRTALYLRDNLFYEVNKVLRTMRREYCFEHRRLVMVAFPKLKDPYRLVYNLQAYPGGEKDNLIKLLVPRDPYARGTCIVMKKLPDRTLTWLSITEAREVQKILQAL